MTAAAARMPHGLASYILRLPERDAGGAGPGECKARHIAAAVSEPPLDHDA